MEFNGTTYHDETPQVVVNELEYARLANARVRLFYGDRATGRDWGEEHDVTGRVGRSEGPVKIPILLHDSRSRGGGGILDDCIVRLFVSGREVWRCPNYQEPVYTVKNCSFEWDGYEVGVFREGHGVAAFKTEKQAKRWIAFMTGKRMTR